MKLQTELIRSIAQYVAEKKQQEELAKQKPFLWKCLGEYILL